MGVTKNSISIGNITAIILAAFCHGRCTTPSFS